MPLLLIQSGHGPIFRFCGQDRGTNLEKLVETQSIKKK